jgi:hypothetical protein
MLFAFGNRHYRSGNSPQTSGRDFLTFELQNSRTLQLLPPSLSAKHKHVMLRAAPPFRASPPSGRWRKGSADGGSEAAL